MKKQFQFSIYPVIMAAASAILIFGIQSGYNQYMVTIPVITLFGLFIFLLERWMPYEKDWVKEKVTGI